MERHMLDVQPLTRAAFAPFGDVIDTRTQSAFPTNDGDAIRFHQLGIADCQAEGGRAAISIFRLARPTVPERLSLMERHPISSQAFVPLGRTRMLVVVAHAEDQPEPRHLRAFLTDGGQGVNYRRGTWHHPLIAVEAGDFLVIDRVGEAPGFDQDYEEVVFSGLDVRLAGLPGGSSSIPSLDEEGSR